MRIVIETKKLTSATSTRLSLKQYRPPSGPKTVFATPIYDEREGGDNCLWESSVGKRRLPVECSVPAKGPAGTGCERAPSGLG
ncbi:hypothetical protein MRX96_022142 [Rhipicephalus microplus]